MATKKSGGTVKNGRDSNPKYLGIKINSGETAKAGAIIVRQRGTSFMPGDGVSIGRDHSLFALRDGVVSIQNKRKTHFDNTTVVRKIVKIK